MKKLLIASTALVATASVAAADVTFNGYGRFGLIHNESDTASDVDNTQVEQRLRLNVVATSETDGGVKFGSRIRFQSDDNSDGSVDAGSLQRTPRHEFQRTTSGGLARSTLVTSSGVHDCCRQSFDFFGFEPGLVGQIGQYFADISQQPSNVDCVHIFKRLRC